MLCQKCKKNQATKTYELIKSGGKTTEYYCLDCYHRLFLYQKEVEGDDSLSACPYCGVTATEFKATKMVGAIIITMSTTILRHKSIKSF